MCDQRQKVNSWFVSFQNWGEKIPILFFCINSEKVMCVYLGACIHNTYVHIYLYVFNLVESWMVFFC